MDRPNLDLIRKAGCRLNGCPDFLAWDLTTIVSVQRKKTEFLSDMRSQNWMHSKAFVRVYQNAIET